MYAGMELLKPLFIKDEIPTLGKIVIGTVKGDLHDLGKNLVLDSEGRITDERLEQRLLDDINERIPEMFPNAEIKTIIGGAPASKEYAEKIGADAFAFDASNSVLVAKELIDKI